MTEIVSSLPRLKEACREAHHKKLKIVYTGGVFDIFHHAHLEFLQNCKKNGDFLVVHLVSDSHVKKIKGPLRPLCKLKERIKLLKLLGFIDIIEVCTKDLSFLDTTLIDAIKPNVIIKPKTVPILKRNTEQLINILRKYPDTVIKSPVQNKSISSTKIIDRILQTSKQELSHFLKLDQLDDTSKGLILKAKNISKNFHNYSQFRVGCSLVTENGEYFSGCNISNMASNLGSCAERNAITAMASFGERKIKKLALYSPGDKFISPCGSCRQIIYEFRNDYNTEILISNDTEEVLVTNIEKLLPFPFNSEKEIYQTVDI